MVLPVKTIELTKGQVAIVDDEDFDDLRQFSWHVAWEPKIQSYYAKRSFCLPDKKRGNEKMHRRILGLKPRDGKIVDHLNHNGLDNQRANLRVTTARGNMENLRKQSPLGVGVWILPWCRERQYGVKAWFQGEQCYIGRFATPEEAQAARVAWLAARVAGEVSPADAKTRAGIGGLTAP
jgi:hypothetical protein